MDETRLLIPVDLVSGIFTPRRVEILRALRARPYRTQIALARHLKRAASHVNVDLHYLEGLGLVSLDDGVRAGPARVELVFDEEPLIQAPAQT